MDSRPASGRNVTFLNETTILSGLPSGASRPSSTGSPCLPPLVVNKERPAIVDELCSRLYHTPHKSQALIAARAFPAKNAPAHIPRPPGGKHMPNIGSPIKTMIFKEDYQRRMQQIQSKREMTAPPDAPAYNFPMRRGSRELPKLERQASQSSLLEADIKPARPTPPHTPSNIDVNLVEDKGVSFSPDLADTQSQAGEKPATPVSPLPQPRVHSASRKQDPSLVLTYLRKNVYDDTGQRRRSRFRRHEPEDDDLVNTVIRMREKLGWVTSIPRHGPGCREAMAALTDIPQDPALAVHAVKEDPGHFVYAIPRSYADPKTELNPYELQVVSAHKARACIIYYTASASNITRCVQGDTREGDSSTRTPFLQWLWERRLYNVIAHQPVFSNYRIWKTFTIWKMNVRNQKNSSNKVVLSKTLFAANEVLQGCLLHVRSLCEAACSSRTTAAADTSSTIYLITVNKSQTSTLDSLLGIQQSQNDHALKQLIALRDKVVTLVWQSCATVAEMEGVTQGIRPKKVTISEPSTPQSRPKSSKQADSPSREKSAKSKPKSDKPSYAQIAEWRRILHRLSYFLRSVDYLLLDLLQRLGLTALRMLLDHVKVSYEVGMIEEEENEEDETRSEDSDSSYIAPWKASVQDLSTKEESSKQDTDSIPHFDFDKPPSEVRPPDIDEVLEEIAQQNIEEEIIKPILEIQLVLRVSSLSATTRRTPVAAPATPPDAKSHATEQTEDSDKRVVKFPEESLLSDSDSEYSEHEEGDEDDEENQGEAVKPQNRFAYSDQEVGDTGPRGNSSSRESGSVAAVLSPSQADIMNGFQAIISGCKDTLSQVSSMLVEPRLSVFYSPPEHDIKLTFDTEITKEEGEDDVMPFPDLDTLFRRDNDYKELHESLMEYIENVLFGIDEHAQKYVVYCEMVDQARRVDVEGSMSKRAWSTEEFQHVLSMHAEQIRQMKVMRRQGCVGFVTVLSEGFCQSCLPYPTNVISAVSEKLPIVAVKRNEGLLTIIKGALKKLDRYPTSVEEFVEHLSFLGKMASEMPALDKEYAVVNKLYTIAKDFDVIIKPEELALYQTLSPSFQHLKSTILYCEAKKDDNIRKFSSELDTLINDMQHKIVELRGKVGDPSLLHHDTIGVVALQTIHTLQIEVTSLANNAKSYGSYQERFGSSMNQKRRITEEYLMSDRRDGASAQEMQAELSDIERDLSLRCLLWEAQDEWSSLAETWTDTPFEKLIVESLQKNVNRFTQTVYMLEKGLPHNQVVPRLKEKVVDFKHVMPIITSLRNPSLKLRHWEQIEKLIGRSISHDQNFTLGNLLEMNITKHKEKIQDISTTASNEATLERMLQKVIDLWKGTDYRLVPHGGKDVYIIAGADDILAQLEESQVTIGTIRGSRYVAPIKAQVEEWERKLTLFSRTLDEWMNCQRNWLYLEQIFTTPDIQRQLPNESKLFGGVDRQWRDLMRKTEDRPNALRSATAPGVLEMLQSANANLDKIHKCLEDYLETKRLVFPRFYFLSNDDLLDILAQSKNPDAVQPHLGKCFGNIKSLDIRQMARQPPTVRTITSAEGEVLAMPKNVRARGPVEQWLGSVENGMFDTVKKHLKLGLADWVGIPHNDWVLKHPGQVVLTVAQIMFNKEVMSCFNQYDPVKALSQLLDKMIDTLNVLAGLVVSNVSSHKRMSINALLTIDVHNRDILQSMVHGKITRPDNFEWTRQLRYEWDEQSNNCNVMQSNATFVYGYEYLGCSPRLVITPLTDRCYLTLSGAMHMHLGGSPAGPAGTGKTETVKDLAKAVGKQCVVFNCSEGLDYKMLGKYFSGMSQSGSWCCFDEFNRIDIEVLSVVAQQIHTIKVAKDMAAPRFVFEGRDIKLNMTCGVFITMNPTYAGRVDLPDNLKSLFRPVAMMVPDYALIAEIILFSEGFTGAKSLSTKIVNMYQLASKQLSQQDHYDFGMRAIKSVLVMAGQRRQQHHISIEGQVRELSQEDESHILIHALRDANIPKFLAEDVPLFNSILEDLFPGITPPQQDTGIIEKAVGISVRDQGLQLWPSQVEKVKHLYSQLLVRHGVMLVGPTGGGKTTVRNILQRALVLLPTLSDDPNSAKDRSPSARRQSVFIMHKAKKGHVETFSINPKCVKLGELYGQTDPLTFEWSDGLIASATRRFAKDLTTTASDDSRPPSAAPEAAPSPGAASNVSSPAPGSDLVETGTAEQPLGEDNMESVPLDWRWLVLDGPVDTVWVENLNTVLDDSKVLCLANGERIALAGGMRLLFEVDNLAQASPATISRCAMVYMDPVELGWRPFVKTWVQRLPRDMPDTGRQYLQAMFDHSVDRGLQFLKAHRNYQMVPTPEMSVVSCLCNILAAFIDFLAKNGGFGSPDLVENRPPSADSQASSRSSSRQGSRGKGLRRRTTKKQARFKEELDTISEKSTGKKSKSETKQYFLQKNPDGLRGLFGKLFVFAFTWSFGGNLKRQDDLDDESSSYARRSDNDKKTTVDLDIANDFDNFVREVFEVEPPIGVRLPGSSRTIYSYFVDMDSGNFVPWHVLVPATQSLIEKGAVITLGDTLGISSEGPKQSTSQSGDLVTTVDTVRYSFLTSLLLLNKNPVLLTGESGVGKSAIVKHLLQRLEKDGGTGFKSDTVLGSVFNFTDKNQTLLSNISSLTKVGGDDEGAEQSLDLILGSKKSSQTPGVLSSMLQFSAQTSAARTQAQIIHKLIKKGRDTLGAPKGKKVIVFVDDLNMPALEEYGAQPPLELLRQFLDLGGFYDTRKLVWKDILDVTVVAACGPPGGGRNHVSPRLLKHFSTFALPQPSTRSLQHIYQVQLGRYFHDGDFTPDVKDCLFQLVSASIDLYYRLCWSMRPTPAKIHYTFNIRDLSQVIQGLMQAHETVIVNTDNCAQLFAHEATRVFHDRLVDDDDRTSFYKNLADNLHDYFKVRWNADKLMKEPVIFGDFVDSDHSRVYKPITDMKKLAQTLEEYHMRQNIGNTQVTQIVFFKEAVEHVARAARAFRQPGGHVMMVGLDGTGKSTTVQLASYVAGCELYKLTMTRSYTLSDFREDLKKVCRLSGVHGKNTVFLLTDSDIVNEAFLEDINCLLNSGEVPDLFDNEEMDGISMELKGAASEAQIPDTRPAVYQFFVQRVKRNLHIVLTMSPAGTKFRQRCRMNPSLINCCMIDWYQDWGRPAMLSVAQVYFSNSEFIADEQHDIEELKGSVAEMCVDVHDSVAAAVKLYWEEVRRRYYITPSSYIELIKTYSSMLHHNRTQFLNNKERLVVGLDKLSEAENLVGSMKEELVLLGPKIEEKAKDTEKLLEQLRQDQAAVDQVREIVQGEEAVMKRETQIVQDYADECQRDLASVLPILQEAIESLDALDKADISEIRVYQSPPELVVTVIGAVCLLLGEKTDWSNAKNVLGDAQFLKRLINFDKNAVPEKVYKKLKKFSKHPDFTPAKVGSVSNACLSMCQWVLALEHYHDVYKMAKPKQKRVEEAKEALQLAQQSLAQKQASLAKIQDHLAQLQKQYQDSVDEREALEHRKTLTKLRLERAAVLISALSQEKVRWRESVVELEGRLKGLVGDTLVSAAAVAYLGAFTAKYRRDLIGQWQTRCEKGNIPISSVYDLVKNMTDPNQVLRWQNEGLPQDRHSTENAIIVKTAQRWPLLIDPQGQAAKWIQQMEGNRLKVVQAADPNYMRTLERAIRMGEPVLLQWFNYEEVTEVLDPGLKPVLLKDTTVRGGHHIIRIGDTEIEYNDNFRLYMTTSMGNPHYLPSVCIQVTLINFTVTFEGLQEQLLSSVVKQEQPQLEVQRSTLLESIASDLQLLRDLEDKSLSLLHRSEGHILDDQDLVDTLQRSKGMSEELHTRVAQSEETEKTLNMARKKYLPVATRGAVLYFVLADLASVDVMYQYSLSWFQSMFTTTIQASVPSSPPPPPATVLRGSIKPRDVRSFTFKSEEETQKELLEHLQEMINRLTSSVYRLVSVGLFAHHQMMFSYMMCTSILRARSKYGDLTDSSPAEASMVNRKPAAGIEDLEWTVFLQGAVMANMVDNETLEKCDGLTPLQRLEVNNTGVPVTRPDWISDSMWRQCQHMELTLSVFKPLCVSVMNNTAQWKQFESSDDVYHLLAEPWQQENPDGALFHWEDLTTFQRLILIKVLRPALLPSAVRSFVQEEMGEEFVSSGSVDLRQMFDESTSKTPLIFLLSPGADPATQLLRFARELRGSTVHLDMISLGRGQGPKAEELIAKAQILKGRWLFLQNCHLAASWMPRLQTIIDGFNKPDADVDPQFRLWLSSKPDPTFPISILQMGIKMTVEPPQGVKANLMRSFGTGGSGQVTEALFEEDIHPTAWKPLLYGLCLFNAVLHERKKYGTLGWNVPCEFNDSDLEVSVQQLQMLLSEQESVPWAALCYLTGEVTYGGRVTDDWDGRCLHSMLTKFYCAGALDESYSYSADEVYKVISNTYSIGDVRKHIELLPTADCPSLFGMNENAERAYLESQAKKLLDTVRQVQPRLTTKFLGSDKSPDEIVKEAAGDILEWLPQQVEDWMENQQSHQVDKSSKTRKIPQIRNLQDIVKITNDADKQGGTADLPGIGDVQSLIQSAMFTVLRQEISRFNKLLKTIHLSLTELQLAIKGEVVMSEILEDTYGAILEQRVPNQWKQVAYESCKSLGSWVSDLTQRVDFFSLWAEQVVASVEKILKPPAPTRAAGTPDEVDAASPIYHPTNYWLSAFFFPQGFLTAVLQNHARKEGISVDSLNFSFEMQKFQPEEMPIHLAKHRPHIKDIIFKSSQGPSVGVHVCGLFLDGARWDEQTQSLQDSEHAHRFSPVPVVHFVPVQISPAETSDSRAVESPLTMFEKDEKEKEKTKHIYECPLYRTSARAGTLSSTGHSTNYVTAVNLLSDTTPNFWIQRGVAMLCQLDD